METIISRRKNFIDDRRGLSNAIVVLLSLILITVIVANVVIWSYQMNQLDWGKTQENFRVLNVERNNSVIGACGILVLNGSQISGTINDTWEIDDSYMSFMERKLKGEGASVRYYYPSSNSTHGGTRYISGSIGDLYAIGDGNYMRFRSYESYDYTYSQITFVSSGAGSGTTQVQLTPSYPPNLLAGDLILLQIVIWDSSISISAPSGFTHLYTDKNETISWQQLIFYKNATGSESGTVTINVGGNALKMARMYAFRNVDILCEGKNFKSGQSTRVDAPSVTTLGPKRLAVAFVSIKDDVAVGDFTGETGGNWTEQTGEYRFKSGNDRGCLQLQSAALENIGTISGGYLYTGTQKPPAWGVSAFALVPKRVSALVQLVEVVFNGTCDNSGDLSSLKWTVCSKSNITTGVTAKFQLYNYRVGAYSTSGQGYGEHIVGAKDENVSLSVTINPAYFVDAETGEWSLKMSVSASAAKHFEFWVDYIELRTELRGTGETYGLSLIGNFPLNLTAYPPSEISSIEVHLRFRTSDGGEYWLLKTYDWINQNYANIGSLSPALSFRYYVLNLGNNWQNYINPANGTIKLLFSDEFPEITPTIIDIDLFAVKVILKHGAIFTVQNNSASTVYIVAVWVNNATHHNRYEISLFVNSGETFTYPDKRINLPDGDYVVKIVTEKGNMAVFINE
ncbi:MAG: hypothetical protein N3F10_04445 [Candidatus Bathyarchaeota archaeon]|nr:hypothetical protein [Candidatus Bathyarchaeota archaeon]MCX8177531.1 hypothetical protein [Candidatus Bathyarchaeota archaeon]